VSRRAATLLVSSLLASLLAGVAFFLPVPYVGLSPSDPYNTLGKAPSSDEPMIEITGVRTYADHGRGELDFTVVSVSGKCQSGLRLGDAVAVWFDRDAAVVPKSVVCPAKASDAEVEEQVTKEMKASQDSAITAALAHLRISRIVVASVVAGSPAASVLRAGDVIRTIDGVDVRNADDLRRETGKRPVGQTVRVGFIHAGKAREAVIGTVGAPDDPKRPVIGIDPKVDATAPFDVKIRTDPVGGPSAGLMLTLGIIELLTEGSLTGGVHVAGTGTINDLGEVGPIGGIHQKLVGARKAGVTHFLVPDLNWDAAQRARPDGLTLHRVATLDDALEALGEIKASDG
jgi:PDZ domain-containing protein